MYNLLFIFSKTKKEIVSEEYRKCINDSHAKILYYNNVESSAQNIMIHLLTNINQNVVTSSVYPYTYFCVEMKSRAVPQ